MQQFARLSWAGKLLCLALFALGYWYPLAGFIAAGFSRLRHADAPYVTWPFAGACASLIVFVVQCGIVLVSQ